MYGQAHGSKEGRRCWVGSCVLRELVLEACLSWVIFAFALRDGTWCESDSSGAVSLEQPGMALDTMLRFLVTDHKRDPDEPNPPADSCFICYISLNYIVRTILKILKLEAAKSITQPGTASFRCTANCRCCRSYAAYDAHIAVNANPLSAAKK